MQFAELAVETFGKPCKSLSPLRSRCCAADCFLEARGEDPVPPGEGRQRRFMARDFSRNVAGLSFGQGVQVAAGLVLDNAFGDEIADRVR